MEGYERTKGTVQTKLRRPEVQWQPAEGKRFGQETTTTIIYLQVRMARWHSMTTRRRETITWNKQTQTLHHYKANTFIGTNMITLSRAKIQYSFRNSATKTWSVILEQKNKLRLSTVLGEKRGWMIVVHICWQTVKMNTKRLWVFRDWLLDCGVG